MTTIGAFIPQGICCLMRVGFEVESSALVSTGIWQGFLLILSLVSLWLFKGSSLPETPLELYQF